MKQQVARLSPHQNGKVFGILMALASLVLLVPFVLLGSLFGPKESGTPLLLVVLFPVIYLVMGYLSVAIGCWFYNLLYGYIGGVEYESVAAPVPPPG